MTVCFLYFLENFVVNVENSENMEIKKEKHCCNSAVTGKNLLKWQH